MQNTVFYDIRAKDPSTPHQIYYDEHFYNYTHHQTWEMVQACLQKQLGRIVLAPVLVSLDKIPQRIFQT